MTRLSQVKRWHFSKLPEFLAAKLKLFRKRNVAFCATHWISVLNVNSFLVPFPFQLEQKVEEVELNNSILIEISKTAVPKWQEKLKTRYGWFKSDNCKHLIFDVSPPAWRCFIFCIYYRVSQKKFCFVLEGRSTHKFWARTKSRGCFGILRFSALKCI